MPSELSRDQLSHVTKLGARVRLAELKQEEAALKAILNGRRSDAAPTHVTEPNAAEPVKVKRRLRAKWTAAQRKAVSERMRKYWAKRRASAKRA